jgi:hypothetical protein
MTNSGFAVFENVSVPAYNIAFYVIAHRVHMQENVFHYINSF